MQKSSTFLAGLILAVGSILIASIYSILAIIGWVDMSWLIFFSWLVLLIGANSLGLFLFLKARQSSLRLKTVLILWATLILWYWLFAPFFYYLNMNVDLFQIRWVAFAYFWEVPIIGGFFILCCFWLFKPIHQFTLARTSLFKKQEHLYQYVLYYPTFVSLLIFIFTFVGYLIGSWQFHYFAYQPRAEVVKTWLNGAVVSMFLSVFYFVFFENYLNPVRVEIEKKFHLAQTFYQRVLYKFFGAVLVTFLGSIGLISLFAIQSFQITILNTLTDKIQSTVSADLSAVPFASTLEEKNQLLQNLKNGPKGQVLITDNRPTILNGDFSKQTQEFFATHDQGTIEDIHNDLKLVVFFIEPTLNKKIVTVTYLTDYYGPIRVAARYFILATTFVMIITAGVVLFISLGLTRSITHLAFAVRAAENDDKVQIDPTTTGDELEALSHTVIHFVNKSREIDRLKDEFVSMASHELKTPLAAMKLLVYAILKGRMGNFSPEMEKPLLNLQNSTDRMIDMVNDFLDVSRIKSGKISLEIKSLKLANLVAEVAEAIKPLVDEKKINFEIDFINPDWKVLADESKTKQILHNLIGNALKFTETGTVKVSAEQKNQETYISVKDTGVGIAVEDQSKLFNRFEQLSVYTNKPPGTGLGLYLSKNFARLMNGDVLLLKSEKNNGSTFVLILPSA